MPAWRTTPRDPDLERLPSPWWLHAGYGALLVGLGLVALLAPPWGEHVGYAGFAGGWLALASWQVRQAGVLAAHSLGASLLSWKAESALRAQVRRAP